jgi:hypothetical protein
MNQQVIIDKKTKFIEDIKKWTILDSQLKMVNEKIKTMRNTKHDLLENIVKYIDENKIENTKIEISDGELKFYEKKEYQPITFTYVEECLEKIISDKRQVEYILNYLKENRKVKVSKDIRRIYTV